MARHTLEQTTQIAAAEAALVRAQLHLRLGKHRLQKGHTAAGMVALYDSIFCGLRYYIASHKGCASFVKDTDVWDAPGLFHALARAGVFEDPLALNRFSLVVERALWQRSISLDASATLQEAEQILTKLGVISSDVD